jgi:hypothetical protein
MDTHVWPTFVQNMEWPKDGMTYSYEHRGYLRPEKIELWLKKAFGPGKARFVVSDSSILRHETSLQLRRLDGK